MILLIAAMVLFIVGAAGSLLFPDNSQRSIAVGSTFAFIGSLVLLIAAIGIVMTQTSISMTLPTSFPGFIFSIHVDTLAAFFLIIIALIALPASWYGSAYLPQYAEEYDTGTFGCFYNLFLLSLVLVVTSYNGFYFLFSWELMALTSLFLVLFEHRRPETLQAARVYAIITHVATAFLMIAFFLIYQTIGSLDFGVIKMAAPTIPISLQTIIFLCLLIGFGTKAGIIPFHIWLPRAHSAAPSHVSALMSGVMIKMGIFMMVRMFFDILPAPSLWMGVVVLSLGATSAVFGVLYALSEHDLKRLLAYHSIENIGIILLGLGSGMLFVSLNQPGLAMVAVAAGLFHTMNHAVFKSLLFLSAGAVISRTHTRDMEKYGGLIRSMPYTALFFLVGALAISGLPPFNGFVSEWLTFQSLFAGLLTKSTALSSLFLAATASLAVTGGLAAACFVKAFGITFLAQPRSQLGKNAQESASAQRISMGFLAVLCLVLGIGSSVILTYLRTIISVLGVFGQNASSLIPAAAGADSRGFAAIDMPVVLLGIAIGGIVAYELTSLVSGRQTIVLSRVWSCGYTYLTPRMEITATGFSRSLLIIFKNIFRPTKHRAVDYLEGTRQYVAKNISIELGIVNLYEAYIYYPLYRGLYALSKQTKYIQSGNLNQYLLYIFIVLLGLLIFARLT